MTRRLWLAVGVMALASVFVAPAVAQPIDELEAPPVAVSREPVWFKMEYLGYFIEKRELPVLVTSGSLRDPRPGALGQPGTVAVIGGRDNRLGGPRTQLIDNFQSGLRLTVGAWLDCEQTAGAAHLILGQEA